VRDALLPYLKTNGAVRHAAFKAQTALFNAASTSWIVSLRTSSCGVAEAVGCGPSGDCRESPAELLERALSGLNLRRIGRCAPAKVVELGRERLDLPEDPDELAALAARLEGTQIAIVGHE
jgi:hypothetical protein